MAIEFVDIDPADLIVSALETRLMFHGTHRYTFFSQDVDLPCGVEVHPIHIMERRKGTLYILLVKKQEADAYTAEE